MSKEIKIDLSDKKLVYLVNGEERFSADIVHGCEGTPSPKGEFQAGKWKKDKTNPKYGPVPWSKDNTGNPYGPYFLPINRKNGRYTTYGIHGTRGPGWSPFESPPVPQTVLSWFLDDEEAKYLYCSHGCIRISNRDIVKLFKLTAGPETRRIEIIIEK